MVTRIYYKNVDLHLGHIQTLYAQPGKCYAVIDDRTNPEAVSVFKGHIEYLALDNIHPVSLESLMPDILTRIMADKDVQLVRYGRDIKTKEPLMSPKFHFQIRRRGVMIGYTKTAAASSGFKITVLFEKILPYIDRILGITEEIPVEPYHITGFTFSPRYLLYTLKNYGIPKEVIRDFYKCCTRNRTVNIESFHDMIYKAVPKIVGIVDPKVLHLKWDDKRTEHILCPDGFRTLRKTVYVDEYYGPVCKLKHGLTIVNNMYIELDSSGPEVEWLSDGEDCYFLIDRVYTGRIESPQPLDKLFHIENEGYFMYHSKLNGINVYKKCTLY
jgi:hypothetical protein